MSQQIIYEQPLNESIRACLRLENLFHQVDHHLTDKSTFGSHQLIALILNIIDLLDRPDLKSKLAKELSQLQSNIKRGGTHAEIGGLGVTETVTKLEAFSRRLIDSTGRVAYRLRDLNILNSYRLHTATPGGSCSFDMPLYHYWLQQPEAIRLNTIKSWLAEFSEMRATTAFVIDLVRQNATQEVKQAINGFHQELLDPKSQLRLIRLTLPSDVPAFPEISVGRHFMSIRFFVPDIENRPTQYKQDIEFKMAYCY